MTDQQQRATLRDGGAEMDARTTIVEGRSLQWAVSESVVENSLLCGPAVLAADAGRRSQTATITCDPDRGWSVQAPVSGDPEPQPTLPAGAR